MILTAPLGFLIWLENIWRDKEGEFSSNNNEKGFLDQTEQENEGFCSIGEGQGRK